MAVKRNGLGKGLAEAPSYGMPINLYDPKSTGAESYMLLAEEVINKGEEDD